MFIRGCSILTCFVLFREQRRKATLKGLQEVSQESSQHKSWSCCPHMQTVGSINVQELKGRKGHSAAAIQLEPNTQPDPPAEVFAATALTVLVVLMSSPSNSFPSSLPNPAVYPTPAHPTPYIHTNTRTHAISYHLYEHCRLDTSLYHITLPGTMYTKPVLYCKNTAQSH